MSLQDLPPEIHSQIFSHLVTSFGPSSIHAVLKTCKQLYEVALPFSVQIFRNTAPLHIGGGPCSKIRNAQFLHYILISKPELAKYVKTLIFGSFSSEDNSPRGTPTSTAEALGVYEKYINAALSPPERKSWEGTQWLADLRRGSSDAQVALILFACEKVESLCFEEPEDARSFCFVLNLLSTSFASRSNLRRVYSEAADASLGYRMFGQEPSSLMALPRLRRYESSLACGDSLAEKQFARLPRRRSAVEEITLRRSFITGSMINHLLGACKSLKSFEYTRGIYATIPPQMLARDVLEAVLPHASTLQHLHVNLDDDWFKEEVGVPERLYMGRELRQMVALKTLVVGMQSLTGLLDGQPQGGGGRIQVPLEVEGAPRLVDCLPDNLEQLQIHSCGGQILDQASELLGVIENGKRFTKLTNIHFLFNHERINSKDVRLRCDLPRVRLEVGFQSQTQRGYELGAPLTVSKNRKHKTICSQIFAEDFRSEWLEMRGRYTTRLHHLPTVT
ncbi:unnamed protein product [Clonostachys solani]|uniref:F-box domain-containing protein n=1 Tax=Clonostachys solani TaxID=160281 RepID=A0A9P0EIP4_9HYPO|nr:unnamed protein product [Clonostachys solani]